jgi:hypothetical protein
LATETSEGGVTGEDGTEDPSTRYRTDELVLPVWLILRKRGECSDAVIVSSLSIPPTAEEQRIMRPRVNGALRFLQEQGYVTSGLGSWRLSEKGLTASVEEVAHLWAAKRPGWGDDPESKYLPRRWSQRVDDALYGWVQRGYDRLMAGHLRLRRVVTFILIALGIAAYVFSQIPNEPSP